MDLNRNRNTSMIILLDTNILAAIHQFNIDIITKIQETEPGAQIQTIRSVINELKNLNDKQAAKLALAIIKQKKIPVIESEGSADTELVRIAKEKNAAIATNDKDLKKKAKQQGIPVYGMRKKQTIQPI
ncbi:MAG: hypothetical protein J4432_02330 [DPANN group archaeon]|nr:hypothetical protein [DPANN group archaeon]